MTSERLEQLIAGYCDVTLDADAAQELERFLAEDPAAFAQFIEFMDMHAQLTWTRRARHEVGAAAATSAADAARADATVAPPVPIITTLQRLPVRYLLAAMLILCVGIIAMVLNVMQGRATPSAIAVPVVATLVESTDAVWDADAENPQPALRNPQAGTQLPGGFLHLRAGIAKIVFASGAEVTLTGPCEFGLNSAMRGFLTSGKIAAFVPDQAHGFAIGAKDMAVVDLGTRFTMSADNAGAADIRVDEGKVVLNVDGHPAQELVLNQSAIVHPGGVTEIVAAPVIHAITGAEAWKLFESNPSTAYRIVDDRAQYIGEKETRGYLRTLRADLDGQDFIFEVTVTARRDEPTVSGDFTGDRVWIGLGNGELGPYFKQVPVGAYFAWVRGTGQFNFDRPTLDTSQYGNRVSGDRLRGNGPYRFRLTCRDRLLSLEIDTRYDSEFHTDISVGPKKLGDSAADSLEGAGRIFIGAGRQQSKSIIEFSDPKLEILQGGAAAEPASVGHVVQ